MDTQGEREGSATRAHVFSQDTTHNNTRGQRETERDRETERQREETRKKMKDKRQDKKKRRLNEDIPMTNPESIFNFPVIFCLSRNLICNHFVPMVTCRR